MSLEHLQALEAAYLMPNYKRLQVEFVRGEGCSLWDDAGSEYLDLLAGIAVDNVGHCHPKVVEAVRREAGQLIHVSNLFYTRPSIELAQALSESSLGGRVFFCNSGAEANEAAIKLARRHKPHGNFVVLEGGFHGRTMGALSATPQRDKQEPFAPLLSGFTSVCADAEALAAVIGPDTAAVLIEPIQGEGGVYPIGDDVLLAARQACDEHGALLIFDEVQTGAGRTGTLWAYESTPVIPDAMTVAKGLGGGLPIGALITSKELTTVLRPGDHGSTFAGGPILTAATSAVLSILGEPEFLNAVNARGVQFRDGLGEIASVGDVRGKGLMIGFEIEGDAPGLVGRALTEERLVINATGPHTVRLVPPLVITDDQVADALARLTRLVTAS